MEQIGMVGASVHISQPYPRNCKDPIDFWESINAWERVLDRHPKMVVVNAHLMDLFYSDEQLEYLQYFLETYPNVYIDTAARFKDFYSMTHEKIRDFFIKYSDRILFGTDTMSPTSKDGSYKSVVEGYIRVFEAMETDKVLPGGFSSLTHEIQGIALPMDVLEKIYFRNTVKLYPRVKDVLKKLGYIIE
jgi:predicted TIM-barrel fold metal-dependent hydrolase